MSHIFNCVLDKNNNQISLNEAQKKTEYKCLDCKSEVRIRQGKINKKHFYHLSKSKCNYYSIESIRHRECKSIIKDMFDNGTLNFKYNCGCHYDIDNYKSIIEYGFKYDGKQKYADVAILYKKDN